MTAIMTSFSRGRRFTLPLEDGETAFEGDMAIGDPSTGTVKSGPSLSSGLLLGRFHSAADASVLNDVECDIDFGQDITVFWAANDGTITASDRFGKCYVKDAGTVSKTSTNRALAGTILLIDSVDGVGFVKGTPFLENT